MALIRILPLWLLFGLASLLFAQLAACQGTGLGSAKDEIFTLDPRIDEASGLTASLVHRGIYWTHNDSRPFFASEPSEPLLYGIDPQGRIQAELWIEGLKPYDWEAVTAFRTKGKTFLLIGDIGDNRARRSRGIRLDAVEEPAQLAGRLRLKPVWTLRLSYPDGPRDAEAMAVDTHEGMIYILSKRDNPARLYRTPLPVGHGGNQVLDFLGEIAVLDAPLDSHAPSELKVLPYLNQPTDMAFAPDGREVVVLTYGHLYCFSRRPGQSWLEALQGAPKVIELPGARQYEGVAYHQDGKGWLIVQEGEGAPVLSLPRPRP